MKADRETLVRDIAVEHPQAVRVFESHGIDYCCGGRRPLEEACREANVAVEKVLEELAQPKAADEPDQRWQEASLADLADHIVEKHHAFVRQESPRLTALASKVRSRHGSIHPELTKIEETFGALAFELNHHMLKEERVLFPMIKRLEEASRSAPSTAGEYRNVEFPIRQMMSEHDNAGELLSAIRSETGQFRAPGDACPSFRALYHGLEEFERDLHRHIHLENNILFPRAVLATNLTTEESGVTL
ncbi:MAG TPA: iron-sulfur cluster repair di-iron protein [Bryobacteraceae bacterium]|nr:iron-sulfur cluster repair di-iron protein [Bryobacteraceae bacterium]